MRTIKFRAIGKGGVMRSWEDLQNIHVHTLFTMSQPELILMQYTGLKDKNGVEIYEGDIVSYHNDRHIGVIEYSTTGGMVGYIINFDAHTKGLYWEAAELYIQKNVFEVIGNIYENPELLEHK